MTIDLHSFLRDQEKEITNAIEGKTLIDYINRNAEEYGNYPALNTPANNEYSAWDAMSWSELRDEVKNLASGMIDLGLNIGDMAFIMSNNIK